LTVTLTPSELVGVAETGSAGCLIIVAAFEPPGLISGFDDVAVMGAALEQGGRHLGVAEHAGSLSEGEVCAGNDGRARHCADGR
jgi:hypothetical protein